MTFGGLISAVGLFSALLLSVTRVPFVLAQDGFLPKTMTKEHPRYGTPYVSIILSSVIYAVSASVPLPTSWSWTCSSTRWP